jgi:hypothetical protein
VVSAENLSEEYVSCIVGVSAGVIGIAEPQVYAPIACGGHDVGVIVGWLGSDSS